jgi:hypothetical protein
MGLGKLQQARGTGVSFRHRTDFVRCPRYREVSGPSANIELRRGAADLCRERCMETVNARQNLKFGISMRRRLIRARSLRDLVTR